MPLKEQLRSIRPDVLVGYRLTSYAFMAANPHGKHGRVVYDLKGDFGLEPAAVRERFGFYFERFEIRADP